MMNNTSIKEKSSLNDYRKNFSDNFMVIVNHLPIKQIDSTVWFSQLEHYPKTVGQIKLMISVLDKIGLLSLYDLTQISMMSIKELDLLYLILRIENRIFNKYLDRVIKNIFKNYLKEIFIFTTNRYNEIFFDQLMQDIDYFICSIIKSYPFTKSQIKNSLTNYLDNTFQKTFYQNIFRKTKIQINNIFYKKHDTTFKLITKEFISYTKKIYESFNTIQNICDKIFSHHPEETIDKITFILMKQIDLEKLLNKPCTEIDIYSEQKIDDDLLLVKDYSKQNDKQYQMKLQHN